MARPRKQAPSNIEVNPNPVDLDERQSLIHEFAPECVSKYAYEGGRRKCTQQAEYSAFFADPDVPMSYYTRRGYEPVTMKSADGGAAVQVTHKGDPLLRRPAHITQAEHDASSERAINLVKQVKKPGNPEYADGELIESPDAS